VYVIPTRPLKQRPSVAFRMCCPDGSPYGVRHPEVLLVSQRALALTIFGQPGAKMPERMILCDPMHVVRGEQINGEDAGAVT